MGAMTEKHMNFIAWCRHQGATRVQVDGVVVDFGARPMPQQPAKKPFSIDDDESLSADEKRKRETERRLFASSQ